MLLRLVRAASGRSWVLLSATLLILAIPPFDLSFLLWVGWVPLLWSLEGAASRRETLIRGALFGAVYYGLLFRWTLRLPAIAFAAIVVGGILYAASFAWFFDAARRLPGWARVLIVPLIWTAPALIADNPWRPFWNSLILLLGMHAPLPLPFLQLARPFGEAGLAFFVLLINVLLWRRPLLALPLLIGAWLWGAGQARAIAPPPVDGGFRVACAQHDLPFSWDWRAAHQDEIFRTYEAMTREAAGRGARMVLFPQYQIPEDIARAPEQWGAIARENKVFLALGTYSPVVEGAYGKDAWVISLVFSPDGKLLGTHKALHPSPIGRPMVSAGEAVDPIDVPGLGRLAILPCYDDVTPRPARLFGAARPDLFAAIANDGLFKGTIEPELHLLRARLRAIENRATVVRCTPNGISAVIDPAGRVLQSLPAERGVLYEDL